MTTERAPPTGVALADAGRIAAAEGYPPSAATICVRATILDFGLPDY